MDSYPGDLLAGVFPLVFAVDAISTSKDPQLPTSGSESPSSVPRTLFDRFLDAVAASLVDDEAADDASTAGRSNKTGSEALALLLRGDDDESSDEEDSAFRPARPFLQMRRNTSGNNRSPSVSFANYHSNEGFFQRARILSISTRRGFPPSKDADGSQNRAFLLSKARSTSARRHWTILEQRPVDGILSVGWLEKHVHALPSALLVVTSLSQEDEDDEAASNKRLLDTIEHLQESLAPKRECHIHIVCLIDDMASISQNRIDSWFDQIHANSSIGSSDISLLSRDDLLPSSTTSSPALRGLHKTVRDASLAYYLRQARRAKHKHSVLGHERMPNLLPLAARYCFKIGVFYEFQLKHAKSLRYFAEAYRHVETYYRYLQGAAPEQPSADRDLVVNPQGDNVEMTLAEESQDSESREEDDDQEEPGTEVAYEEEQEEEQVGTEEQATNGIPDDMAHQCRAVADWLNFKLLQAGFLSSAYAESPDGVLAACSQWRRHAQCFFRKDRSNPAWNHWAYVSHQRLVMSQLVERYKPRSLTELPDEVLLCCSAWRSYQAAVEATLCLKKELGKQISKAAPRSDAPNSDKSGNLRQRYVGGLDSEALVPKFEEEAKKNHTADALEWVIRAISLFENDVQKAEVASDNFDKPILRSSARLYYLAGGILFGRQRYQEAIPHLQKAVSYTVGWDGLQFMARHMLVECFENHTPDHGDALGSESSSFVLDALYNSGVPPNILKSIVSKYTKTCEGGPLKWYHGCTDKVDSSCPISFAVTFPGFTHATAGDKAHAAIRIKSNLKYPFQMRSMALLSSADDINVPLRDLLMAENTTSSGEYVVIQPDVTVVISTDIALPRDLEKIRTVESSSPDKQADEGKGNSVKSARPRTAGITAAAGARLVSEETYGSGPSSQWSLSCIGGRALRCDGIRLGLSPLDPEEEVMDISLPSIELTIEMKKPLPPSYARRTPFEDDNYVAQAWYRPPYVSFSSGPRCLRVLGPMPKMTVTNLTTSRVNGKALEGTVNRTLLRLKAGDDEICRDLKYSVTCSSTVLSLDGTPRTLTHTQGPPSPGGADESLDNLHTPVLVGRTPTNDPTEYGFELPQDWHLLGTGQKSYDDDPLEVISALSEGAETYIELDLYRPLRNVDGNVSESVGICQTDFTISISYRQTRRVPNDDPTRASVEQFHESDESAVVSLEHSGSVVWASPLSARFSLSGLTKAFPSGSRHPLNLCPRDGMQGAPDPPVGDGDAEIALIDSERVSAKCTLRPNEDVGVEITQLRFEDWRDPTDYEQACTFRHVSDGRQDGVLYESTGADFTGQLTKGSQFGITYTIEANMLSEYKKGGITTAMGSMCVLWKPLPVPTPDDVLEGITHGPLILDTPSVMTFRGPPCYVESAPFETILQGVPGSPRVAVPFEMSYCISNKTGIHQKLSIRMNDAPPSDDDSSEKNTSTTGTAPESVLVSGMVHGELCLAPYESQTLSYTALAMRAGTTVLPALNIASDRYKTWVVHGGNATSHRQVYVLP